MAGFVDTLTAAQQVELIYVAYFNRAAEGNGYLFWQQYYANEIASGKTATVAMTDMANLFQPQAETLALYPFLSNTSALSATDPVAVAAVSGLLDTIYSNLFGRTADTDGKAFWSNAILTGSVTLGTAILAIADGATGTDVAILTNKVTVASSFTTQTTQAGLGTSAANTTADLLAEATSILTGVTADTATVTTATTAIGTYITNGGGTAGTTYTLTTGVDAGTAFTGTSGNDTFIGVDSATDTSDTLNSGDSLNGGAGTDTLSITAADSDQPIVTLAGIENVKVSSVRANGSDTTLSAASWTGVSSVTLENTGFAGSSTNELTVSNLQNNVKAVLSNVNVNADNDQVLELGFAAGKIGSTTATLTVEAANVGGATRDAQILVDTSGDIFTTLDVTATAASFLRFNAQADGDVALTTVNVAGAGAVKIEFDGTNVEFDTVTTFNAAANTGGVTADLSAFAGTAQTVTGGSGADTLTVDLQRVITIDAGAGNDVVTLANPTAANLSSTTGAADSIKGGEGTADVLQLTAAGADALDSDTAADRAVITGFERLRISDDANGTTIDASAISGGINYVQLGATVTTGAATINGLTSGATIEYRAGADLATNTTVTVNANITNATTAGTDDLLNVVLNADLVNQAAANNGIEADLAINGVNRLAVSTADRDNTDAATTRDDGYILSLSSDSTLSSMTVTGSSELSYTASATATSLATINASALTGDLILDLNGYTATQGVTVTGGAGANTVTGSTQGDVITGGARADTLTGDDGADSLTGGAGADTFVFGSNNANLSGGTPSATVFDTITDFAKASDIIDLGAAAAIEVIAAAATAGVASINAEGIASFHVNDDTLAERITAVEAAITSGTETAGDFAIFEFGSDSYVFVHDGTAGLANTDVLIKLTGVTGLSDSTITGATFTIA